MKLYYTLKLEIGRKILSEPIEPGNKKIKTEKNKITP